MDKHSTILIVGHNDIIEHASRSYFNAHGYSRVFSSRAIGLNPTIQASVYAFFQKHRPAYVFLASTRSGGIEANKKNGAEFLYHNSESQNNILYASWKFGVQKLLYFAGSCIYPKECPQPMREEYLLTGPLEKTSEPYSVAKIAGVKLCQAFKEQYGFNAVVMVPATIYGPGSDVDIETSHVMGALIGKFARAVHRGEKEVVVWGTGTPRREFLFVDDFVAASLFLMKHYDGNDVMNAGCARDVSIKDLAETIAGAAGFKGRIVFDATKPDGTMRKLLDSSRVNRLGWTARVSLEEGIKKTYAWYQDIMDGKAAGRR
jgi:GDP-L-fucose synthase